jgi:hypothetical protein
MKESEMTISSPMLVIGVGDFAGSLLPQVQTLFFHSDLRRAAMVGFFKVVAGADGHDEMKLEAIGKEQGQESSSLEAALHDLRLHEKFLQVGLGDEQDLPLGAIVLVDLTEEGSASLYSLLAVLCEMMAQERGGYMYLLCKTAIFNTNPSRNVMQARVHLHLKKLETHIKQASWAFQTYLFDGLKEGSLEAKDEDEVSILMQNFLLALLSGRLAQRLAHAYSLADGNEGQVFFNSAGATALIYDPSILQETCAKQLAAKTLEVEFLAEILPDPGQMDNAVNEILEKIGDVKGWAEKLCADTPFHTHPAETIKLDLHFSDLQFDGLPPQEWGDAIVGYAAHFEKQVQTLYLESLVKNSSLLGQASGKSLESGLTALPTRSNLYPNGIANSLQVLQECARAFYQRIQACLPAQNEEETLAWLDGEYQASMENLDQAISELPEPPRWVKRLPGKLSAYAKVLFEFFFLRREHAQLLSLREKIVRALEDKSAFQFEGQLRRSIIELCNQMISSLEKIQSELNALQAKFHNSKNKFGQLAPAVLPGWSPFRVYLMTPALLQWAYERGQKDSAEIRAELLEGGFLDDWHNISEEHIYEELIFVCRLAYQFLNDMYVEEILKHTDFADLSSSLVLLAQGAVPALRPDFDTAGESSSYLMNYFLCADPRESGITNILKTSARERREWQEVTTGDPYMNLFCRVRQMIPLNALSFLTQSTKAAFEGLSEQDQKELQESFERAQS